MVDLSTWWRNLPDLTTPVEASVLNAWGSELQVQKTAAAASAAAAAASALAATAPGSDVVAGYIADPASSVRAQLDGRYAPQRETAAFALLRARLAASLFAPTYVIMCGDSYISGQDATRQEFRFVDLLGRRMQAAYPSGGPVESPITSLAASYAAPLTIPGIHVLNGAVGGTSSADYLTATTRGYASAVSPKIVVHVIGTNDLAIGPVPSPATYKANIAVNIAALPTAVHVLVHGALRPDAPWEAADWLGYAGALAELAAENPASVVYIDISAPFFAANATNGADPLDLMTDGGIHPNDAGQALMAAEAARLLGIPGARSRDWFITDAFTRTDAAVLYAAGHAQTWTPIGTAVYTVASGKAVPTTAGIVYVDALRGDVEVAATVTMGGTFAGFALRILDGSNYIMAVLTPTLVSLYKVVAGATTGLANFTQTHTAGVSYQVRAVISGASLMVYVNGRVTATYTLTGPEVTTFASWYRMGLYCSGTLTMKFDDFGVRPA